MPCQAYSAQHIVLLTFVAVALGLAPPGGLIKQKLSHKLSVYSRENRAEQRQAFLSDVNFRSTRSLIRITGRKISRSRCSKILQGNQT
jgi:hypothetical protein